MRGNDEQQLDVFSYISPEERVPQDHPLHSLRVMTDEALQQLQPRFNNLYAQDWTAVDCAGEVVASIPAASAVLCAQRTDVNGTVGLQPAVSMVRGFEYG